MKKDKKVFKFSQPNAVMVGENKIELITSDLVEEKGAKWSILLNGVKHDGAQVWVGVGNAEKRLSTVQDFWGEDGHRYNKRRVKENHEFKMRSEGYYFIIDEFIDSPWTKKNGIDKAVMQLLFEAVRGVLNTIVVRASCYRTGTVEYYQEMGFNVAFRWADNQVFMQYQFKPFTSPSFNELKVGDNIYVLSDSMYQGGIWFREYKITEIRSDSDGDVRFFGADLNNKIDHYLIRKHELETPWYYDDDYERGRYISTDKSLILGKLLVLMRKYADQAMTSLNCLYSTLKHLEGQGDFDYKKDIKKESAEIKAAIKDFKKSGLLP